MYSSSRLPAPFCHEVATAQGKVVSVRWVPALGRTRRRRASDALRRDARRADPGSLPAWIHVVLPLLQHLPQPGRRGMNERAP